MPAQAPSATNVFVRDHAATGHMVVDFSRDPKSFAVNNYIQIIPTKKTAGFYLEMTVEEAGRILNADLAAFAWPDNSPAPRDQELEEFQFKQFVTARRKFGFQIGTKTAEQASWDIIAQHARIKGQLAMTARTQKAVTALTTAANYASNHTSAVGSISGVTGNWAQSTTARQAIKRSLIHAAERIRLDTLSAVKPDQLRLVLSPACAKEIAVSQEIVDYIKGSPQAWAYVKGDLANDNRNQRYGLPPFLYDFELVIEDAVKVTSRRGAAKVTADVLASTTPFMCSRVGGLEGIEGAPTFTTCCAFMLEEFTVETMTDTNNRLHQGRVVEDYDIVMTAPVSGFLFTSAI